jgi:hypothetical protein
MIEISGETWHLVFTLLALRGAMPASALLLTSYMRDPVVREEFERRSLFTKSGTIRLALRRTSLADGVRMAALKILSVAMPYAWPSGSC